MLGTKSGLVELRVGDCAIVTELDPTLHPLVARRLADLGFAPGTQIEVLRRAPLGYPVIYRICGYEIALRSAQTKFINVELKS